VAFAGVLAWTALTAEVATAQDDATPNDVSQNDTGRPLCELVLPATTRAFVSAGDTADLMARWDHTRLGELIGGPAMNSFVEEVYDRLQEVWLEGHQRLGIEWSDVRDVPTGQVALGYVHEPDQRPSIVLWMDVEGNVPAAEALLEKVKTNLIEQGAQREEVVADGATMVVYTVPPREGSRRNDKAVHFLKDGILVVAGGVPLAENLLARWDGAEADSLGAQESFGAVMQRCRQSAGEMTPELRWFIDPFPLVDALKEAAPPPEEAGTTDEIDVLLALRNQGFDAVTGVGGFVHLDEGPIDILHRTAVYAPGARRESMKLITLPNAVMSDLPAWVSDDVASIKLINIDATAGFEALGKLFDEMARAKLGEDAEGLFDEIITDFLDNQFGEPVDIRKDIIGNLGSRAVFTSDYTMPITPESERTLIAIETTSAATIAKALESLFGGDDTYIRQEVGDAVIWESVGEEETAAADEGDEYEEDDFGIPPLHFTVAHGYLFVSSNVDIIKETLQGADNGPRLSDAKDFRQVGGLLDELGATETCYRSFSRTDEAIRVTYELIRKNRLREATSILGRLANLLLENGSADEPAPNVVDGGKLPRYEVVRDYVGPSGMFALTEDEGWYSSGFILGKGKDAAADDVSSSDSEQESPAEEVTTDEDTQDVAGADDN
jgi:hypothetical protein